MSQTYQPEGQSNVLCTVVSNLALFLLYCYHVLDYIYSMNGVTQHAKPVTVGQPPVNNMPVGKCSVKTLALVICDFYAAQTIQFSCSF